MSSNQPKRFDIGQVEIGGEAGFGDTAANFDYFRCDPPGLGLSQASIRLDYQRQGDQETGRVVGASTGTVTLTRQMHGFSTSTPTTPSSNSDSSASGATAFDHYLNFLAASYGNVLTGGYSSAESASTTSTIKMTDVTSFKDGQAMAWNTTDEGYQVGWAKNVNAGATPDEITLLQTAMAVPTGNTVHGSHTVFVKRLAPPTPYLDDTSASTTNGGSTTATTTSWTIKISGSDSDDLYTCLGCILTGHKMTWNVGEVPKEELTFSVGHFSHGTSGASTAVGAFSYPSPEAIIGGGIFWGASAATSIFTAGIEIDLGLEYAPIPDIIGDSGIGGWFRTKITPRVTFSTYRDESAEITDWQDQNGKTFSAFIGSEPGRMMAVCMPNAYVVEMPARSRGPGGETMSSVVLEAGYYAGDTAAETDLIPSNTDFRLAFL